MRKGRLSRFLGWPSFSLCGGWKCGGWNEPYAGDVAAVRAGLRRRILLRLRKSAKNIETGAELASGSDSSPCLNNADPRSLSSITPPLQQPIPLPHPRRTVHSIHHTKKKTATPKNETAVLSSHIIHRKSKHRKKIYLLTLLTVLPSRKALILSTVISMILCLEA